MKDFSLHPQLIADARTLGDFSLSRLLLMDDARYPWLILVPRRVDLLEICDLSDRDQQQLMLELSVVMRRVRETLTPDKLNVAAIGNLVPQLHLHVVARFIGDAHWPRPVWGLGEAMPYSAAARAARIRELSPKTLPGFSPWEQA